MTTSKPDRSARAAPISPKRAARLDNKKYRERRRLFLAEGRHLIRESPEPPLQLFETEDDVRRVSTLTTPTGPVGVFPFLDVAVEEVLSAVGSTVILLDGMQDPGNVGAIVRSAHAFGAAVVLSRGCADLYNAKTVRATMGSLFHVRIAREVEPVGFLRVAQDAGFETAAAVPQGGESPKGSSEGGLVISVGAEGSGLSREVIAACQRRVTVPSRAASLNAAVAASILLYEAYTPVLP